MNTFFREFLLILIFVSVSALRPPLTINGESDYQIVLPEHSDTLERLAAAELCLYIEDMSSERLPVVSENAYTGQKAIYIGNTELARTLNLETSRLGDDGFIFKPVNAGFIVTGHTPTGALNGVYTLLESFGCRRYTSECTVVPKKKQLILPEETIVVPPINFRVTYYRDALKPEYRRWHKLSDQSREWGLWVHTFNILLPPEKYFDEHPEYYDFRDGKRMPTQLCLANPDVRRLLVENLRAEIAKNPQARYWSVSQNDNNNFCQCDACRHLDKVYGGDESRHSGSLIHFVNEIATSFPEKTISTLAYLYSRKAPKNIKPAPNVNIMLCDIESKRQRPVFETDTAFSQDLHDWGQIADNLFVWDYEIQFSNVLSPFPNLQTIAPNVRFFIENSAKGLFMQGNELGGGEWWELRAYLISKLLWNPWLDPDRIIDGFLDGYYEEAAPYLRAYIDIMRDDMLQRGAQLDIFGEPEAAAASYMRHAMLNRYEALFDRAERAVRGKPDILRRVREARLPLTYAALQISLIDCDKPGCFYQYNRRGHVTISKNRLKQVNRFLKDAHEVGITQLKEWYLTLDDYSARFKRIKDLTKKEKRSLAFGKRAMATDGTLLPTLTDGMFDLAAVQHSHGLKIDGRHLDFVVDLEKVQTIKYVQMDFFDIQDKLFYCSQLPEYVTYSLSTDNINFSDPVKVENPTNPRLPETQLFPMMMKTQSFIAHFDRQKARYIRVHVENIKQMPMWHAQNCSTAMFTDEIIVR